MRDAVCVGGRKCCEDSLRKRLMLVRREVLGPRYALSLAEPSAFSGEHFVVELKDFFVLPQLPHIFSHVDVAPPGSDAVLPVLMSAIVRAVDEHGDLMRMAIASPGVQLHPCIRLYSGQVGAPVFSARLGS